MPSSTEEELVKDMEVPRIGREIRELVHSLNNKMVVIVGRTELALYTGRCGEDILKEVLTTSKEVLGLIRKLGQLGRKLSEQEGRNGGSSGRIEGSVGQEDNCGGGVGEA